eukprot:CAMPEP_0197649704 /NCGR_PEP_ID=MMETSP1338-20131121/29354_1 /TAXON_ID=43686 ORGANISM="Pelagodinium beii, Strain RCC1491" /NCGR_SAMPLE_ID=MMETSP1338 /ASSEMBLY_ACC=CAM_ASM_000754 /LENGTH=269 /DNA_ID=CAMNT_0043223947 /DNA_START=59 /DNA_END=868 /DNA_ORIENTATION=+
MAKARSPARPLLMFLAGAAAWMLSSSPGFAGAGARSMREHTRMRDGPTSPPSDKFKFVYFDAYGRIETSRMLMVLAGQDYEDFRYPISFGTPGDKSTMKRDEFDSDQKAGKFDYGMNMIPVVEAGEFRLPQSKAIERYMAKKLDLMGSTLEEEAWVDALNEHIGDIGAAFGNKESDQKWFQEDLPAYLKKLEITLPGSEGFAVGTKSSLADVAIYRLLRDVQPPYDPSFDKDVVTAYSGCPKIKAIVERLDGHEGLQKWITERPKTTVG